MKKWMLWCLMACLVLVGTTGLAEEHCRICGGDYRCDTCQGTGFQTLQLYGMEEMVRVACTGGCDDGRCPVCIVICDVCGSDGLCDMCQGNGYLQMQAFGTNDDVKVVCPGEACRKGQCTACMAERNVLPAYDVKGFNEMQVAVEVDSQGRILFAEVIMHGETPGFGADLIMDEAVFDALKGQYIGDAQIDVKAGVTLTSNAINEALRQAAENEGFAPTIPEKVSEGIYEVDGFWPMKVAVSVNEAGLIRSVRVIEHNETPGLGASLIEDSTVFAALEGQYIGDAQIDVKTGVTHTSNAINEALRQAAENEDSESTMPEKVSEGIYEVEGFYPMKVSVSVNEAGLIRSVRVIEHNETPGLGASLIEDSTVFAALKGQYIGDAQIDVKAGVTHTSNAINEALRQAAGY